MRESVIHPQEPTRGDAEITWRGTMAIADGEPLEVTHRFTCDDAATPTCAPRTFLLTFLPVAMRIGDPVRIEGEIDDTTLEHLQEWQEAMVRWHPGSLHVVPIRADEHPGALPALRPPASPGTAITAFSGGVDSSFTAVRDGVGAVRLAAGLMVQGFDIALDDPAFTGAFARSARILEATGLAAHRLQTDVRARLETAWSIDWQTFGHGIWLAAALSCFEGVHDRAVIPSTFPYDQQVLPWASNPITDPFLGGAHLPVHHDGAAFDKLDKVRHLAGVDPVLQNLRVCWEGASLDRNCGHCYKCLVTQACFWVSGVADPRCFDHPGTAAELTALDFRRDRYRTDLAQRIAEAARRADRHDVATAIDEGLAS